MTIQLPPNLETPILDAVQSGRYVSLDAAMAEAAAMLVQRLEQEQAQATPSAVSPTDRVEPRKPIWERIQELTADVPDEEWDNLPTDLAEQHDHYIYGTPKRPTA